MKNLLLILLLLPFQNFAQSENLENILNQTADKMGGVENWKAFQSHIIIHESEKNGKIYQSTLTMKMPNKFRIDLQTENYSRTKSYDGKEGWIMENGHLKPMPKGEDEEMAEEADFYGELVLGRERGYDFEFLGKEKLNGKKVYKIKMKKSETDEQFYYINSETYLPEMVAEYSADVNWEGTFFKTTFADWKEFNGLLFPMKMELFANDKLLRNFQTTDNKVNVPVEDESFSKDIAIIRNNIKQFSAALMSQDYDVVIGAYTEDGKIFPNGKKIMEGEQALKDYWIPAEDSNSRITYHKITPTEIKIENDTAYDFGYYEGKSIGKDGNEIPWRGKYVIVWKEVKPDVWKMYLDIWNAVR